MLRAVYSIPLTEYTAPYCFTPHGLLIVRYGCVVVLSVVTVLGRAANVS